MVEIIKKGDKRLVDCFDCGSILKFDAPDIYRDKTQSYDYDVGESYDYYVVCPECKEKVYVTSKITSSLERKVDELEKRRNFDDV